MVVLAVIGPKGSGKTATIEVLIKGLKKMGLKVATIKHIPEREFTIDTPKKDTWRHAKAGADIITAVSPNEIAIIRKGETTSMEIEQILALIEDHADVILIEGFKGLVREKPQIPKIVMVREPKDAEEAIATYRPILAFVGQKPLEVRSRIPYVDLTGGEEALMQVLGPKIKTMLEKEREKRKMVVRVLGSKVQLNPFVRNILRNTIMAMLSSLKGVDLKGEEKIVLCIIRGEDE